MGTKYILMGVAGCGKTTIGNAMAERFGWTYLDGDTLHPQSNIDKMTASDPLNDDDRAPWLNQIGQELAQHKGTMIIGCSALKRIYRQWISTAAKTDVCFIHLHGSRELIETRMAARKGHFMPMSLLDSQFATLEMPENENAITIDISGDLDAILTQIERALFQ